MTKIRAIAEILLPYCSLQLSWLNLSTILLWHSINWDNYGDKMEWPNWVECWLKNEFFIDFLAIETQPLPNIPISLFPLINPSLFGYRPIWPKHPPPSPRTALFILKCDLIIIFLSKSNFGPISEYRGARIWPRF